MAEKQTAPNGDIPSQEKKEAGIDHIQTVIKNFEENSIHYFFNYTSFKSPS